MPVVPSLQARLNRMNSSPLCGRLERELEVVGVWFLEVLDPLPPEPGCALDGDLFGQRIGRISARARPWRPLRPGQSIPFPV
ncbi:MAG: hypothetical protein ACI9VR_003307 [Cognaticolwellia sp.]|jgi:hypothetical protein